MAMHYPFLCFNFSGMCKLHSGDKAVIQNKHEKIFSITQSMMRSRLQHILVHSALPLASIGRNFASIFAGLVTKVGGTLVVAFTIYHTSVV